MREALSIILIILSVVITTLVLVQSKGADLGGFLGGGDSGNVKRTRRGVEAFLHNVTIWVAVAFFVLTLVTFFVWSAN